jgi:hypothetical protein
VTGGVEVLLERLLATKRLIAVVAFKDIGWGVEVLLESLLLITLVAHHTLERELRTCSVAGELVDSEGSAAELTALGHFR